MLCIDIIIIIIIIIVVVVDLFNDTVSAAKGK
jgi:hypothetical protein